MTAFRRIGAAALLFLLAEGAIFRSGLYALILEPDSAAGNVQTLIRNERARKREHPNQVVAVGHSRMGLLPRVANEMEATTGYRFGSISVGGGPPRVWYYMLRETDPQANRYAAVIIPVDDYDEPDPLDPLPDWKSDMHYLIPYLRIGDVAGFAGSFEDSDSRWEVIRGLLLKGIVYRRDFQELLSHPAKRWEMVKLYREGSADWNYSYTGETGTMAGASVDWANGTVKYPADMPDSRKEFTRVALTQPLAKQTGWFSTYQERWIGKIVSHYAGSRTKVILIRLPRCPVRRPGWPPAKPDSTVRRLAAGKQVIVTDEHYFDPLERVENFMDPWHLNADGMNGFSRMLARLVRETLGPPEAAAQAGTAAAGAARRE